MANCSYCSSTIIFGGVRADGNHFCNAKCQRNHYLLRVAQQLPPDTVQQRITAIHQGPCPKCKRSGPVDLHRVYRVWSAFVFTRYGDYPRICCRSCATRSQLLGILSSFFLGWWGFPWGIILTPLQIARNIDSILNGPNPASPSYHLHNFVRIGLAAQLIQNAHDNPPPRLPQ